jgi:hypothetical protein
MNNNLLTSIATLPTGYIEYLNVLKSEGIIRTSYKNKRGVYLWTNKINGHQYISKWSSISMFSGSNGNSDSDLNNTLEPFFVTGFQMVRVVFLFQ